MVYVMIGKDRWMRVFECPVGDVPSSNRHGDQTAVFKHSDIKLLANSCPHKLTPDLSDRLIPALIPAGTPTFGVAAVSVCREKASKRDGKQVLIHFWPSSHTSEHDGESHLVIKDATGHAIHIPGNFVEFFDYSNSGTTLLVKSHTSLRYPFVRSSDENIHSSEESEHSSEESSSHGKSTTLNRTNPGSSQSKHSSEESEHSSEESEHSSKESEHSSEDSVHSSEESLHSPEESLLSLHSPEEHLYLIRYVDGAVSMHELNSVKARDIRCGAVDDSNGTVYLIRSHGGVLHCISYA
jgi:hypothetical protein